MPALAQLRAMAPSGAQAETRFIVLGRGKRRRPRLESTDLVRVDADFLFRRTLFDTLALAAGRARPAHTADEPARVSAGAVPEREDARRQGRLILVAEDNQTNRMVIQQQLRLLGFAAEVVVNGQEALQRWRSGDYALLLTDLHMPVMDGYALAAAIRSEETVCPRIPIIALTANVVRDEELHCLAVGMDAYLTKPIRLHRLRAVIEARLGPPPQGEVLAPGAGEAPAARSGTTDVAREPAADLNVLIELVGDDPEVIGELLDVFRRGATQARDEMRQGVAQGSAREVADAAHKLKSGASSIGARRLAAICAEMEAAVQARQSDRLGALLVRFEAELEAVRRFLQSPPPHRPVNREAP
jgi:CheY-like chemotaxis protein